MPSVSGFCCCCAMVLLMLLLLVSILIQKKKGREIRKRLFRIHIFFHRSSGYFLLSKIKLEDI